ncbi:MAG: CheR family methyltransferase, partial [Nitrospirota bacterium]
MTEDIQRVLPDENSLTELLEKIYIEKGWDFRSYKKSSLIRRIAIRLDANHISSYQDYSFLLDSDHSEYDRLFSVLTIKVSEFFREPRVFSLLKNATLSRLAGRDGLRAWSCGCAYGNEAYSIAILLAECLGLEKLRNAKIYATDIDNDALDIARAAVFHNDSMLNVSDIQRERYFFGFNGAYKVRYDTRDSVRFGSLNIVKHPPISKIDILFCRNLLIYFEKGLQMTVLRKLDYA